MDTLISDFVIDRQYPHPWRSVISVVNTLAVVNALVFPAPARLRSYSGALSLYVRLSQAFGTGTMQMFIDRLSSDSIAD
jgi:hypothetical protein